MSDYWGADVQQVCPIPEVKCLGEILIGYPIETFVLLGLQKGKKCLKSQSRKRCFNKTRIICKAVRGKLETTKWSCSCLI